MKRHTENPYPGFPMEESPDGEWVKHEPWMDEVEEIRTGNKGFIKNCILVSKINDVLFTVRKDGTIIPTLDGYAIIPREEHEELKAQGKPKLDHKKK
jgi:hypothetical protein